ncbi:hypothetical protein AX774_g8179 [Zancudomyces culisetae]|uniref:Uncharacterized protein n=1 Tax=Zancudomyces culisetae TaxID=1213189 RepID=A0A1R1PBT8_ZANCU|nr:hypothetical protein AX774_g8179 [Zancudomyces culisetae]|eukprot:OMH78445.1 hypothetical protein AX774_g8179 [Zancudomyces culisetae]
MDLQELFYRYDSSDESSSESECKSANEDKFNTANGDLIKNSKYVLVLNKRIPEQKLFERLIFCIDVDPFNMQLKSDLDLNPATWSLYGALFGPQVPLVR